MKTTFTPRLGLLALPGRTFRSLRHQEYRIYFGGQIISFTGSWMQSTALMWLVFDHTSNPIWPSLMLVAALTPTLFLGPLGGLLADRFPKRRVVISTQLAFLVLASLLTVMVAMDYVSPWLLLAFQLLSGIVQAIDLPARLAFVPDLIPKEDLINAVGLNSLLFNGARAVGPALAGAVFIASHALTASGMVDTSTAKLGAMVCFGFNSLSYAAVLWALTRISDGVSYQHNPTTGRFWDGIRYLQTHSALGWLLTLTGFFGIFSWPILSLLPAYTRFVLQREETAYSILVSAMGAGALLGALITATFGSVSRRSAFLLMGVGSGIVGLLGVSLAATMSVAVAGCFLLGLGCILYLSTGQSTLQLHVHDDVRGRVMATWAMTLSISAPLGHLITGYFAQTVPVPLVLTCMLVGMILTGVGILALVMRADFSTRDKELA